MFTFLNDSDVHRKIRHLFSLQNIQHPKGVSSSKQHGYDTHDYEDAEIISTPGAQRLSSSDRAAQISFAPDADKLLASTDARMKRSSSPFEIEHMRSSTADNNHSRRIVERDSPSHPGLDYGLGRVMGIEEASNRQRDHRSVDTHLRYDIPDAYSYSNDSELEGPRALIDAYGKDQGVQNISCKPTAADYMNTSGISNNVTGPLWQNSEEEEFDWEDMSPALSNGRMNTELLPSSTVTLESFTARPGFETLSSVSFKNDFRRDIMSGWAQHLVRSGSSIGDDSLSSTGVCYLYLLIAIYLCISCLPSVC